ncbi:flagellar hook assembly protein FlgD [Piscinibacter sp.]|uniref:flagellar hook assembly protein FlgD n=1 Tax=Piscinibacter sp. TaxID=1903157 RepID=UPI0039E45C6B
MAVSSVSSVGGVAAQSSTTATDASERFLKLLVAQMQNQDPLNPMDNAQVTSQMAQIQTVTGIEKLNTTVEGLSSQFVQLQALQGASLVGRDVIVPGNLLDIHDGVAQGGFELTSAADAVKVEVLSAGGQVIDTLELGAQTAGMHSFDWNAGTATNDTGLRFRVTSRLGGVSTTATPLMRDSVNAVAASGTGFSLELARGGSVDYRAVKAFN